MKKKSRAWKLLSRKGSWTQGAYAKDANGRAQADGKFKGAVKFCALGAIWKLYGSEFGGSKSVQLRSLTDSIGVSLDTWNDHKGRTRRQVVALLKKFDI